MDVLTVSNKNTIDFNQLYKQYYKEIASFCQFKLHSKDIADEVVNDSFMKLYNNLENYDASKANIKTWLFTIVNHTIIDYQRKYSKNNNLKTSIDNNTVERRQIYEVHDNSSIAIDNICSTELKSIIVNSIKSLNGISKDVAELYFLEELTYSEISEIMNISLSNVKVLIHRIRIELQNDLRKKDIYI